MAPQSLSLRNILLLTIGALTLLIVVLVAQTLYMECQRLGKIHSLKDAAFLGDQLFDAAEKLSVERDIAFSMLHAPSIDILEGLRPGLESSRREVDATLKEALKTLETYDYPELREMTNKSAAQLNTLQELRGQIDQAIVGPLAKHTELSEVWFEEVTSFIQQTNDVWMAFIKHYTDVDPRVALHIRFKHFLRIITDYTGRSRSLIGRLIVENADPSPRDQALLLQWQGMVDLSWSTITLLANQSGLNPAITPYVKDAQSHYLTLYDMVRGLFYVPGARHKGSYPIDPTQWFELATDATDSLYALKDAAIKETSLHVQGLETAVKNAIIVHIMFLLFALVLCFYSFRVVIYRVIGPINAMIGALFSATEGKTVALPPATLGRDDEIGKLAQVLQVFQQNTEKITRTSEALNESEKKLHQAQKMEAIGNLTGGMAHDFNNLLGVIIGNLDLLAEKLKDRESAQLSQSALDAALRGADLTRRLLAFARQQPLQPQQVDVNQLVEGITKLLGRMLGEDITISLNLAKDVWPVVVDPVQLEAAITNLATNARDAMPEGGKLIIATSNGCLDADYATDHPEVVAGDYAVIEVSDSGAGMPPDIISRIFEPFFTTKERGKGTGLGLAMVFGFMKQSGGHVNVYSEVGAGTTFRLYLPRATQSGVVAVQESTPIEAVGGHETILVVEDNEAMRDIAVRQLKELGYQVIEAENAAVALERLEGGTKIDLMLTDIIMPGKMNGIDLANKVMERWPAIKVILTSGFPETKLNSRAEWATAGMRLLSKPYRKADLARRLREALDSRAENPKRSG